MINIFDFINTGTLDGIGVGASQGAITSLLGEPDKIEIDTDAVYCFYKNLRLFFHEGVLEEITLLFEQEYDKEKYSMYIPTLGLTKVTSQTKFHEMVRILLYTDFKWRLPKNWFDKDYYGLVVNEKVVIVFDLMNGELERISYHNGYGI